ncbi:MAG: DUF1569 domain-containing protein [Cyclobacteriaceae bacterium]
MPFPSVFDKNNATALVERINKISANTKPQWGKMDAAQMLAHLSVPYEIAYDENPKRPPAIVRFMLKSFVKNTVVSEKPYKKNSRTAPDFIISDQRVFEEEKQKLVRFINETQKKGTSFFDGKQSVSFGKLTTEEWNNLFYKHLDHHLQQFGA